MNATPARGPRDALHYRTRPHGIHRRRVQWVGQPGRGAGVDRGEGEGGRLGHAGAGEGTAAPPIAVGSQGAKLNMECALVTKGLVMHASVTWT